MAQDHHRNVTDEDRREFLKVLGVTGVAAAGGVTLNEARQEMSGASTEELAPIGQAIHGDLAGKLDAGLLADQQTAFAEVASTLPTVGEKGLPQNGQRNDFQQVAEAGQPIYEHLTEVGFFESTTSHLPEFTPAYLKKSAQAFVGSEELAQPFNDLSLSDQEGADLVATVVANAERLSHYHWVATDEIPREQIEGGEFIPPMTQAAAGGILLWFGDLDSHFWQHQILLTDKIISDAVWYSQSMAAGFHLMTEGAKRIADRSGGISENDLSILLSMGFAIQSIAQGLLPEDVYWITEEMRSSQKTALAPAPYSTSTIGES